MTRLEQVKQTVEAKGYKLVSADGYKNQDSLIVVECAKGHKTTVSLSDFKKVSFECPSCNQNVQFNNPMQVPPKQGYRVIGFDQATEHFGVSVFDNGQLVFFNLFVFTGTVNQRLVKIQQLLRDTILPLGQPDYVVMEDIQQQHGAVVTYKILAMLLGVLETTLTEQGISYEVVSPNVGRKYAGTCGKTRLEEKQLSVIKVKELFSVRVNDDVAEAILIGRYGAKAHSAAMIDAFGVK